MSDPVVRGAGARAPGRRSVRADARRNRERIVAQAAQIFARDGLEVPMDAIARGAGVGAGTLYRHFPTKQDLLGEVLAERTTDLARRRREIEEAAPPPGEALEQWLDALGEWMRAYDGLPGPLREAYVSGSSPLAPACAEVIEATQGFLEAAQRDGVARPDVDAATLYQAALASAWVAGAVGSVEGGGGGEAGERSSERAGTADGAVGGQAGGGTRGGGPEGEPGQASGDAASRAGETSRARLASLMRRGWERS